MKQWIRKAWRCQPDPLRRIELRLLAKLLDRPLDPARSTRRGDVVIAALLGTAGGIGEVGRLILQRLRAVGIAAHPANLSRFAALEDFDGGPLWSPDAGKGGLAVFFINPDLFGMTRMAAGLSHLRHRRIAGMWAWELETIPQAWIKTIPSVDEIWVHSKFIADAFRKAAPDKPVYVVPPPIDVAAIPTAPRHDPLPQFKGRLIVFFMFDVRSTYARKNPDAVIEAFRRATQNDPAPVLVIKVNNADAWPETNNRLMQATAGMNNVHIMHEKLSRADMQDLLARVDIVMSLHHSEGFGFLMAEGMAAGKPVIATGWSGNMDFMAPDCSVPVKYRLVPATDPQHIYDKPGSLWAEPDIDHAASALRRLLDDPAERQRLGKAARAHIEKYMSAANWFTSLPGSFWNTLDDREAKCRILTSFESPKAVESLRRTAVGEA
jgi:glycosyltransferase involved in cell wall biosynthesis